MVFNPSHKLAGYQIIMQVSFAGVISWEEILEVGFVAHVFWLLLLQTY